MSTVAAQAAALAIAAIIAPLVGAPIARADEPRFLKGQTHLHSNRSGDSHTPPSEVARWYAAHGFDFIVFTDHNEVSSGDAATAPRGSRLVILDGVELTQNLEDCTPLPTVAGEGCLLHVNALVVHRPPPATLEFAPLVSRSRRDVYGRAVDLALKLGGLAQINHPNFHHGLDAALLVELAKRGALLVEIANQSDGVDNGGDATHPSTEALWDAALTAGATLWGVASDDAHQYYDAEAVRRRGGVAEVGDLGYVMVRARRDESAIRDALARGDFYSSTGVSLDEVAVRDGALAIDVAARGVAEPVETRFIGAGGKLLARVSGLHPRLRLDAAARDPASGGAGPGAAHAYVRAVVVDAKGRRAWVQPVPVPMIR